MHTFGCMPTRTAKCGTVAFSHYHTGATPPANAILLAYDAAAVGSAHVAGVHGNAAQKLNTPPHAGTWRRGGPRRLWEGGGACMVANSPRLRCWCPLHNAAPADPR